MVSVRGAEGSILRWGGIVLLGAGLLAIYLYFPTRPDAGDATIRTFELDSEECEAFRSTRLTSELTAPPDELPLTLAEVAKGFDLELALVCQANHLTADCGGQTFSGEQPLTLPLYRDPSAAPRPEAP